MRNLALQGEVRHALHLPFKQQDQNDARCISGKIVAVIRNTSTNGHLDVDFHDKNFDYHPDEADGELSKQPPSVFVMTSDGKLLAMDANDRLVWVVDLEKVVLDSQDEDEGVVTSDDTAAIDRSEWFYAAGFLQEESSETNYSYNNDAILGLKLNNQASLHLTCLSRSGHVVSVSVDSTTCLVSQNGNPEEGSECIGTFENGLECGGWSPDGEVLALVTFASEDEDGNPINVEEEEFRVPILMTMNTQHEILAEVRLKQVLPAVHNNNNSSVEGTIHPNAISLCWRPDSSSLAVSTMDVNVNTTNENTEVKPLRRIRTFSRTTLQLLSLSKEEDGSGRDVPNLLPVSPTWAPGGCSHYVAAVQSSRSLTTKTSARGKPISMQVAFMEPNGLRHRECKIHMTYDNKQEKEEITGTSFNPEGDLLAVTAMLTPLENQNQSDEKHMPYGKLQLYHRSNYHWYLKYELRYDEGMNSAVISNAQFSAENPYEIIVALDRSHTITVEGQKCYAQEWREYTFRWDSSTVYYRNNPGCKGSSVLAMVIDGKALNVTPLDKAIIPPPMYGSSLEFPSPVVGVTTRPCFYHERTSEVDGDRVEFLVLMSDGKLALLTFGGDNGTFLTPGFSPPTITAVVDLLGNSMTTNETGRSSALKGTALRDITIIDAGEDSFTVVAVSSPDAARGKQCVDNLIEMNVTWGSSTAEVTLTALSPVDGGLVLRVVNWRDSYTLGARGSALIELSDGALLSYSIGGVIELLDIGSLLEPCPWIVGMFDPHADATPASPSAAMTQNQAPNGPSNSLVIGLSSRYRLYCMERLISSATSSFDISIQHRILTHITLGSRPHMRFLPIQQLSDFDPLSGSDENAVDGYEPRSVETGARLVAVFPMTPSVVIQLPRGNLESISPRALALPYVMTKIRKRDYLTALDVMRRQRIDTNLIVDIDPSDFLEKGGAEAFVSQIKKIDNINLFLSSLIDVDTTLWKYPIPNWLKMPDEATNVIPQTIEVMAKVNRVCAKMREVMLTAEQNGTTLSGRIVPEGHFLLPILSTFAKESPPRLEEALTLIKRSASQAQKKHRKNTSVLLSDHVQSAIQYVAFLSDYELIFNTAIGMYDFELAKAVARHSQMDPKVYLPMLKRWREMPEPAARYEVDVKLKRYESALHHLVSSGESEEPGEHFSKCLKFIEDYKLHSLGLQLFINDVESTSHILKSLGEALVVEGKFDEAVTVFLTSEPKHFDGAKRAAKVAGDWRAYFACCGESGDTIEFNEISAIAERISSKMLSPAQQKEAFADAARILLDYGQDVAYALDMYISAQMWFEGRRVAHLHKRPDLAKKCTDAAVSYATSCIDDLVERSSTFETTNEKYAEVIVIRRDAIKEAEETGVLDHQDDTASLFSMQSTASNSSLRSTASGSSVGSVGSVASVSTVISVGTKSSFQFTGDRDTHLKHKSKFNKIGRDQKKKKKKAGPAARRMKPGSEEHLKELVTILTNTCPDDHLVEVISETISFLLQSGKKSLAKCLFEGYLDIDASVRKSQTARIDSDTKQRQEKEKLARKEGLIHENIEHPCEKEVNEIICKPLPSCVENVMTYFTS